jgi:prepilin-type N-terminal cleavage/methylation domain-containing protein
LSTDPPRHLRLRGCGRAGAAAFAKPQAAGRRAFTLIELVAATALSAVLLTVVLSVVRTVNRPQPTSDATTELAAPLSRQLQWDLANAVVLRTDARGLTLGGYGSLDPATLEPTHVPVVVTYTLRPAGDRLWLVREQSSLDALAEGGTWDELACGDVAAFTVDAPPTAADRAAATQPAEDDPTPLSFQRLAGVRPVPPRVRLTITLATTGHPSVEVVAYR